MFVNFQNLKTTPCSSGNTRYNPLKAQTTNKITKPKMIGLLPPDFPPGKNFFINFCKLLIRSSKLGGSLLAPEPLPLDDGPPGLLPQGDWLFKMLSFKLMLLYIVTFYVKTS